MIMDASSSYGERGPRRASGGFEQLRLEVGAPVLVSAGAAPTIEVSAAEQKTDDPGSTVSARIERAERCESGDWQSGDDPEQPPLRRAALGPNQTETIHSGANDSLASREAIVTAARACRLPCCPTRRRARARRDPAKAGQARGEPRPSAAREPSSVPAGSGR